jgi:hypothetical protein
MSLFVIQASYILIPMNVRVLSSCQIMSLYTLTLPFKATWYIVQFKCHESKLYSTIFSKSVPKSRPSRQSQLTESFSIRSHEDQNSASTLRQLHVLGEQCFCIRTNELIIPPKLRTLTALIGMISKSMVHQCQMAYLFEGSPCLINNTLK